MASSLLSSKAIRKCSCLPRARARETVNLVERETPAFISPNLWPVGVATHQHSSEPGLLQNMDKKRSGGSTNYDVDEPKQRLINVWHGFEQSVIDDAVDEWLKMYLSMYSCEKRKFLSIYFNSI